MAGTWTAQRRGWPSRARRGLLAAFLSATLPGAGQFAAGRRLRGLVLMTLAVALGAAAGWIVAQGPRAVLRAVFDPRVLGWLVAANAGLLAFRLFATFDAYRLGARAGVPRAARARLAKAGTVLALAILAAGVVAPHAAAGYYTLVAHDLLTTIFVEDAPPPPPSLPAPPTPVVASPDPPAATPSPPAPPPPPPPEPNPWLERSRITVALLGSDAGPGRSGARIDTLMVATVDTDTGAAAIFSVPRNLRGFPLPDGLAQVWQRHCPHGGGGWELINALYRCGTDRAPEDFAALYPGAADPAAAAVRAALGELLGIPVDYHALVDMSGFVRLVDALGGVEVEVAKPVRVRLSPPARESTWRTFDVPAGLQRLDGEEALAFVRSRTGTSDFDRMRRQRCLVAGVAARTDPTALLRAFPQVAAAAEAMLATNLPLRLLPDLVEVLALVDLDRLVAVGFVPPEYQGADNRPHVDAVRERVREVLRDPLATAEAQRHVEGAGEVCR